MPRQPVRAVTADDSPCNLTYYPGTIHVRDDIISPSRHENIDDTAAWSTKFSRFDGFFLTWGGRSAIMLEVFEGSANARR